MKLALLVSIDSSVKCYYLEGNLIITVKIPDGVMQFDSTNLQFLHKCTKGMYIRIFTEAFFRIMEN